MKKKLTILTILSILSQAVLSQDITIVPQPVEIEKGAGGFTVSSETKIVLGRDVPEYLGNYLSEIISSSSAKGSKPERSDKARMRAVNLWLDGKREDIGDEGYRFVSGKKGITISAASPGGLFYGIQTMRQLMKQNSKGYTVTAVSVTDYPRFRWRGYLLDPARHFRTKDEIKRYIDLIALCKMNIMQLHLTDDQGWRIEIKKYPELTLKGASSDAGGRKGSGWYYTQEDIKELVKYAESRFVTLVPEIEMPGHSFAATSVYPHLGCEGKPASELCVSKESTGEFSRNVLTEVISLFSSPYVHVGADEVQPDRWRSCPSCSGRIKDMEASGPGKDLLIHNVRVTSGAGRPYHADISLLQGWYNRGIDNHIAASGRRMVGWDEIMDGGLDNNSTAIVMAWRSDDAVRGAISLRRNVVVSLYPDYYLDNNISLERTYSFDPVPAGLSPEEKELILGVQGNMWGESTPTVNEIDERTFPRLAAIAETGWTQTSGKNFEGFSARIMLFMKLLQSLGVNSGM